MVKGRQTSCIRVRKAWAHFIAKVWLLHWNIWGAKIIHTRRTKVKRKIPTINLLDFAHSACRCKKFGEMPHRALGISVWVKQSINSLILLWCGLITGLFCWAVSGRWFHSHNAPQLLLTTSWFLHFYMYGFLGPRPPRITHGHVVSSTRPRSLRHHLKKLLL